MPIPCPIRFVHPFPNAEDRVNRCHTLFEVFDGHLVAPKCCYAPPHLEPRIGRGVGGGDNRCLVAANIVQRCRNLLTTVSIAISFSVLLLPVSTRQHSVGQLSLSVTIPILLPKPDFTAPPMGSPLVNRTGPGTPVLGVHYCTSALGTMFTQNTYSVAECQNDTSQTHTKLPVPSTGRDGR